MEYDLIECVSCEGTGYVYIGFGDNDVEECDNCENGFRKVKGGKQK